MKKISIGDNNYIVTETLTANKINQLAGDDVSIITRFQAIPLYNRVYQRKETYKVKYVYYIFKEDRLVAVFTSSTDGIIHSRIISKIKFNQLIKLNDKVSPLFKLPKVVLTRPKWRDLESSTKRLIDLKVTHWSCPIEIKSR